MEGVQLTRGSCKRFGQFTWQTNGGCAASDGNSNTIDTSDEKWERRPVPL